VRRPEPITLSGPVVRLEPIDPRHHADLAAAVAADPAAFRVSGPGAEPDGIDGWMRNALDAARTGTRLPLTVILAADGRAVGSSSYMDIVVEEDRIEIGHTWYGGPWQGTAVNPASKLLLLGHAFEDLGAQRVALRCDARNEQSRRAILALGAQFEGVLRRYGWRIEDPTKLRDTALYSIVDDEWPVVRDRLIERLAGFGFAV
jgi:RimJ/RimL family protein N-acetyltransferase